MSGGTNLRTPSRLDLPMAMLVGVNDELGEACAKQLRAAGLRVEHVRTPAMVCERLAVAMPRVVILSDALDSASCIAILEHTTAIGAEVVVLEASVSHDGAAKLVEAALGAWSRRRGRGRRT